MNRNFYVLYHKKYTYIFCSILRKHSAEMSTFIIKCSTVITQHIFIVIITGYIGILLYNTSNFLATLFRYKTFPSTANDKIYVVNHTECDCFFFFLRILYLLNFSDLSFTYSQPSTLFIFSSVLFLILFLSFFFSFFFSSWILLLNSIYLLLLLLLLFFYYYIIFMPLI